MSYLSNNVIPGNHGKIFGTDAQKQEDIDRILEAIRSIDGVKSVHIEVEKIPKEFMVNTSKMVEIKTIEEKVKTLGFHAVPMGLFEL
ncbi:MAG: heavy-metal-associated domain-containing protein [Aequorivita sp.]|nr:heavy-metal-associated domain-containing protein [Aequorivita sp.]